LRPPHEGQPDNAWRVLCPDGEVDADQAGVGCRRGGGLDDEGPAAIGDAARGGAERRRSRIGRQRRCLVLGYQHGTFTGTEVGSGGNRHGFKTKQGKRRDREDRERD